MKTNQQIKIYLLMLVLSCSIFTSHSQIGVKAGIGYSDIVFAVEGQSPYLGYETDYLTHRYPLFSFQFGIFGNIDLNRHFDFQPELLFVKQGLNYDMDYVYGHIYNRVYLYYLQVPAVFRYRFSLKKKHHPNFFLGPYFGLKVHSKRIKTYGDNSTITQVENAKPFDFGLLGGFGYDFKLKSGQLATEIRWGYSLVNIMNAEDGYIPAYNGPDNLRARNVNLSILIGYRFSIHANKQKEQ